MWMKKEVLKKRKSRKGCIKANGHGADQMESEEVERTEWTENTRQIPDYLRLAGRRGSS